MITNEQIINQIKKRIAKKPLFYITRYKERGSGLNKLKNYKIITSTPPQDTAEILEKKSLPSGFILVFKNNAKIQRICCQKNLKLLNPDYLLNEKYENKISQYQFLKEIIPQNLPKTIITTPAKSSFKNLVKKLGSPFIGQFNRSHTGQGTILISNAKQWKDLKEKFSQRQIKCAEFINAPTITINICLWQKCVLMGSPSYQITGFKKLTDFPFSTVGNDWSLAQKLLKQNDFKTIKTLSQKIGRAMIKHGWRGLFGLDFIKDKKWCVIEINARQPASTSLETILQRKQGQGISIFAVHLTALLKLPLPGTCHQIEQSLQKINQGGQIIIRRKNKNKNPSLRSGTLKLNSIVYKSKYFNYNLKLKKLKYSDVKIIKTDMQTKKHNTELFRIQSFKTGFITKNNQLNNFAKELLKINE